MKKYSEMTREERIALILARREKRIAKPNKFEITENDGLYIVTIYDGICDMVLATKAYKKRGNAVNLAKRYNAVER